jgi:hypothetical protein
MPTLNLNHMSYGNPFGKDAHEDVIDDTHCVASNFLNDKLGLELTMMIREYFLPRMHSSVITLVQLERLRHVDGRTRMIRDAPDMNYMFVTNWESDYDDLRGYLTQLAINLGSIMKFAFERELGSPIDELHDMPLEGTDNANVSNFMTSQVHLHATSFKLLREVDESGYCWQPYLVASNPSKPGLRNHGKSYWNDVPNMNFSTVLPRVGVPMGMRNYPWVPKKTHEMIQRRHKCELESKFRTACSSTEKNLVIHCSLHALMISHGMWWAQGDMGDFQPFPVVWRKETSGHLLRLAMTPLSWWHLIQFTTESAVEPVINQDTGKIDYSNMSIAAYVIGMQLYVDTTILNGLQDEDHSLWVERFRCNDPRGKAIRDRFFDDR